MTNLLIGLWLYYTYVPSKAMWVAVPMDLSNCHLVQFSTRTISERETSHNTHLSLEKP